MPTDSLSDSTAFYQRHRTRSQTTLDSPSLCDACYHRFTALSEHRSMVGHALSCGYKKRMYERQASIGVLSKNVLSCDHQFVSAEYNNEKTPHSFTYDHRTLKIRLPVRSAIYKQCTGGLVVRWVTTSESPLLYVFVTFLLFQCSPFFCC